MRSSSSDPEGSIRQQSGQQSSLLAYPPFMNARGAPAQARLPGKRLFPMYTCWQCPILITRFDFAEAPLLCFLHQS